MQTLTAIDLCSITTKPKLNEFSFESLLDFYEENLCNRLFVYHLGPPANKVIKLRFEEDKLCHLLGFQHIFKGLRNARDYVGQSGYDLLRKQQVTFDTFKDKGLKQEFKSKKNRILLFPFVYQILLNPTAILFSNDLLPTNIETEFFFYRSQDGCFLHLGVDSDGQNPYYFPKTFVERNNRDFIENQMLVSVLKIEVILD